MINEKDNKNNNMKSLNDVLQSIYTGFANLETNMTCQCTCCRVAMPQVHYAEYLNIVTSVWDKSSKERKIEIICTCIEYYFKQGFEKWGMESLIKPCVFHDKDSNLCTIYDRRPLNCALYGLWPSEDYEKRVDVFAKAYEKYGVKREDLPLAKQCDKVKRVDDSVPLTTELIEKMYHALDKLDQKIAGFSDLEIEQKHNYRTFHDWLLFSVFGEDWLTDISNLIKVGEKDQLQDLIVALKTTVKQAILDKGDSINPTQAMKTIKNIDIGD